MAPGYEIQPSMTTNIGKNGVVYSTSYIMTNPQDNSCTSFRNISTAGVQKNFGNVNTHLTAGINFKTAEGKDGWDSQFNTVVQGQVSRKWKVGDSFDVKISDRERFFTHNLLDPNSHARFENKLKIDTNFHLTKNSYINTNAYTSHKLTTGEGGITNPDNHSLSASVRLGIGKESKFDNGTKVGIKQEIGYDYNILKGTGTPATGVVLSVSF